MKKLFFPGLIILLLFNIYSITPAKDEFENIDTLSIVIDNDEYKGNRFLEDGRLYVSLEDLKEYINITTWIFTEGAKEKVYVLYGDFSTDYRDGVLRKNSEIYVPVITFCEAIKYYLVYDEKDHTLSIQNTGSNYLGNREIYDLEMKISGEINEPYYYPYNYYPYYPYSAFSYYPYNYSPYSPYGFQPYYYPCNYVPDYSYGYPCYYGHNRHWRNSFMMYNVFTFREEQK